jgi:hypothetical protein
MRIGRQDLHDEIRTGRTLLDDLDAKILDILNKSSFKSVHSITETLYIARSAVLLHLHNSIGFRSFYLHWVLYLLTHDLREKRMQYTQAMLPILHAVEGNNWHYLISGDES